MQRQASRLTLNFLASTKLNSLLPKSRRRPLAVASFALVVFVTSLVYSASSAAGLKMFFGSSPASSKKPASLNAKAAATRRTASKQVVSELRKRAGGDSPQAAGELNIERRGHTATPLADGRILIVGGENSGGPVAQAELYDSVARSFALSARLNAPRSDHTATRLSEGRVLIIGGRNQDGALKSTEVFDPSTNTFSQGPSLKRARAGHTATALRDGRILIAGGDAEGSAETYDPQAGRFSLLAARLTAPRSSHAAALLKSGKVLIVGGLSEGGSAVPSGEVFDPETQHFTATRNMMRGLRTRPTLNVLPDGKVQVIGGDDERSMEMFNAEGGYFTAYAHLLPESDSQVGLVEVLRARSALGLIHSERPSGGESLSTQSLVSEMRTDSRLSLERLGDLLDRSGYSATEIPGSGQTMIAGGQSSSGQTMKTMSLLEASAATVTTDYTDYSPGDTVIITGTNWQAGETVELRLHRDGQDATTDTLLSAVATEDGTIQNSDYVVRETDLGVSFLLTCTGQTSGYTAQTTFTDSPKVGSVTVGAQSPSPVSAGNSATYTITVNRGTGSGSPGAFSANLSVTTTLPAGASASFSPNPVSLASGDSSKTATLTISTEACSTPSGSTPFTVQAARTDNAHDNASGNGQLSVSGVADTTAPTITTCAPAQTAFANASCQAAVPNFTGGIVASDNCTPSGSLTITQSPAAGALVGLGATTVTITVKDAANNSATCSTTFTVSDNTPPTLTLNGTSPMTIECHTCFTDPGATASDNCAGNLTGSIQVSGAVNVNVPGAYTLTYNVSDPSGNPATAITRTVNVVDTTPPTVTLNGANPMTVECHSSFADPGATATDTCAGNLTGAIQVTGSVNPNAVGTYTLTYTVSDGPEGNTGTATRTVNVVDTTKPLVTLNGAAEVTVECHTPFTDQGATASDACAGSVAVSTSGSVDANTPGTYTLTYSATDPSNNTGTATRTVHVVDTTAPAITLNGANPMTVECHSSFTDPGATASDNCASSMTVTPSGSVNVNTPGTYTITYSATDGTNTATKTRTFNVVDTTPPVITLNGSAAMTVECHTGFTDPGASASDACTGSVPVNASGSVNINIPGAYTITYSATDGINPATKTRTVYVVDTTAPVINLNGANPLVLVLGSPFTDPGATATDACAGDLTSQIVRTGSVNMGAIGTYTLTYNVSDPSNNAATEVTRTVQVQYSPACGHVILPPINPDGSSVFKQKSTVPAKFRVCDANGVSVGTPGVVSNFKLIQTIAGTASATVNEEVSSTTPDPYFRWDPVDQQWIFNIDTKVLSANKTYVYRISLNDGSFIDFRFGLK